VPGLGLEVALDAVIDEGDEACCNNDTKVVREEEVELNELLTRRHQ
jgi:hypothetical protein